MKIRILQGFVIGHGKFATVGEELTVPEDLSEHQALDAIARGMAADADGSDDDQAGDAGDKPEGAAGEIQQRDPRPTARDPGQKKGGRR